MTNVRSLTVVLSACNAKIVLWAFSLQSLSKSPRISTPERVLAGEKPEMERPGERSRVEEKEGETNIKGGTHQTLSAKLTSRSCRKTVADEVGEVEGHGPEVTKNHCSCYSQ